MKMTEASDITATFDFKDEVTGNAAVFCSDERFVEASLSFLKDTLGIKSCDLIVTAGGPAFINAGTVSLMDNLKLLHEEHKLKRLVLISHEDCKYYSNKFKNLDVDKVIEQQVKDLIIARQKLPDLLPDMKTEIYFAALSNGKITFNSLNYLA
jgi:hypothetical protein